MRYNREYLVLKAKLEIFQNALEELKEEMTNNLAQIAATINFQLSTFKIRSKDIDKIDIEELQILLHQLIGNIQNIACKSQTEFIFNSDLYDLMKLKIECYNSATGMLIPFQQCEEFQNVSLDEKIVFYVMWKKLMEHLIFVQSARQMNVDLIYKEGEIIVNVFSNKFFKKPEILRDFFKRGRFFGVYCINKNRINIPNSLNCVSLKLVTKSKNSFNAR